MTATPKQISYLRSLASDAGFETVSDAAETFGLRRVTADELSIRDASTLIEWLKNGGRPAEQTVDAIESGSRVAQGERTGIIVTNLSDGRCIVRFDDGSVEFVAASEIHSI